MDTTTYLTKLLNLKQSSPGGVPLISKKYLEVIQHNIIVDHPELIFHIASSVNEPMVIEYLLDRYEIDPNQTSYSIDADDVYSPYMNAMMFACYEVIDVFLTRKLYPELWYLLFLFVRIHNKNQWLEQIVTKYDKIINLSSSEVEKLKNMFNNSQIIMNFLNQYPAKSIEKNCFRG